MIFRKIYSFWSPFRNADAIVSNHSSGEEFFVEPLVEQITMQAFFRRLDSSSRTDEVSYLQSQNGNVHSNSYGESQMATDFEELKDLVPRDIEWASQVLGELKITPCLFDW